MGKLGKLFYTKHVIILPKPLKLGNSFSISVRFFNPCPFNGRYHTLIQSSTGLGGLFVVDEQSTMLGCFSDKGKWIDSGIDLQSYSLQNKWLNIIMCYTTSLNHSKIHFYLDGVLVNSLIKEKVMFNDNIRYIGNSKDLVEPFGAFCDLRVYPLFLDDTNAAAICSGKR